MLKEGTLLDFVFFSAWGESLFLLIETALIALMVLAYRGKSGVALLYLAVQISATSLLLSGYVPEKILKVLQATQMVVVLLSKVRKKPIKMVAMAHGLNLHFKQTPPIPVNRVVVGCLWHFC